MSEFAKHVTQGTCHCPPCVLIACDVLDADWPDRKDIAFAGDMRVAMYYLTRRFPVLWPDVARRWAGAVDWFDRAGCGLRFEEDDDALP